MNVKRFEIREGNDSIGTFHKGHVIAENAHEAIRAASRMKMIHLPAGVRLYKDIKEAPGGEFASIRTSVQPCRWIAQAILVG